MGGGRGFEACELVHYWGVTGVLVILPNTPLGGQVNPTCALSVLDLNLWNDSILVVNKSLQCVRIKMRLELILMIRQRDIPLPISPYL